MKRETTIKTGAWPHKALWNQQQLKRWLEQSFRIVWNNFQFTSHHSRFKKKIKQVRFYLLFNFHLQFTNKSVGSLWFEQKRVHNKVYYVKRAHFPAWLLIRGKYGREPKSKLGVLWNRSSFVHTYLLQSLQSGVYI